MGLEMKEKFFHALPAVEAGRLGGSGFVLSDSAQLGLTAADSKQERMWTEQFKVFRFPISQIDLIINQVLIFVFPFTFIKSNNRPLKIPWYLLSKV